MGQPRPGIIFHSAFKAESNGFRIFRVSDPNTQSLDWVTEVDVGAEKFHLPKLANFIHFSSFIKFHLQMLLLSQTILSISLQRFNRDLNIAMHGKQQRQLRPVIQTQSELLLAIVMKLV